MRVAVQQPPWRVIRAFRQSNGAALVHLHNVSGGVLAGDSLSLRVDVGPGAAAQVTSTSATRLYRHRCRASDSEQQVLLTVDEGGLLEYLPDPLIPFAGARHKQRTAVQLADKSCYFAWEVLAPGRQAMGELFAYESLRLETGLYSGTRPLFLENFHLEPHLRSLHSPARLGAYLHTASFYAVQVGRTSAEIHALESRLSEVAREVSRPGVMMWGSSALASDGVIVRGLSSTTRDLPATLVRFWNTAKRFLTGEEAVPPRKLK